MRFRWNVNVCLLIPLLIFTAGCGAARSRDEIIDFSNNYLRSRYEQESRVASIRAVSRPGERVSQHEVRVHFPQMSRKDDYLIVSEDDEKELSVTADGLRRLFLEAAYLAKVKLPSGFPAEIETGLSNIKPENYQNLKGVEQASGILPDLKDGIWQTQVAILVEDREEQKARLEAFVTELAASLFEITPSNLELRVYLYSAKTMKADALSFDPNRPALQRCPSPELVLEEWKILINNKMIDAAPDGIATLVQNRKVLGRP